jgi:putative transposase
LLILLHFYILVKLSWRLSNTLDSGFCVDCLQLALQVYGQPEIFNTDQGCQFTSEVFTGALKTRGIAISIDGRGRALDNIFVERLWRSVKHEDIYLKGYALMPELLMGLTEYFVFYNTQRPHQFLNYSTPDNIYQAAIGGGARIVDKYRDTEKTHAEIELKKNQNQGSAVQLQLKGYPLKLGALLS